MIAKVSEWILLNAMIKTSVIELVAKSHIVNPYTSCQLCFSRKFVQSLLREQTKISDKYTQKDICNFLKVSFLGKGEGGGGVAILGQ